MALTPEDINAIWSAKVWQHFGPGTPEAVFAKSIGYPMNTDGSVDIQNTTAGSWLALASFRTAMLESQVTTLAGTQNPDALAAAISTALIPHLPTTATVDVNAIAQAVLIAYRAQVDKP